MCEVLKDLMKEEIAEERAEASIKTIVDISHSI